MRTVEVKAPDEHTTDMKTYCYPDGDSIQGRMAVIGQDAMNNPKEVYWWVSIGGIHKESIDLDQYEWADYVTWINQMDALIKGKFDADK